MGAFVAALNLDGGGHPNPVVGRATALLLPSRDGHESWARGPFAVVRSRFFSSPENAPRQKPDDGDQLQCVADARLDNRDELLKLLRDDRRVDVPSDTDLIRMAFRRWCAVEVDGAAVGFLAQSGTGKSTLILAFLARGHRVIGDDHVVIGLAKRVPTVAPTIPWLKVGPDVARHFGVSSSDLAPLHPSIPKRKYVLPRERRTLEPRPLRRLYLLERSQQSEAISFSEVAPGQALAELVRHSFAPRTVAAAGLEAARLQKLARVLDNVALWRLRYPDALDRLDEVCAAVVRHIRRSE